MAQVSEIKATPRNPYLGLLADVIQGADGFIRQPFGLNNPPASLLSDALGIPAIGRTVDRMSYGEPLTTGKGWTTKARQDTAEALMSVPVAPKAALGVASMGLGASGAPVMGLAAAPTALTRAQKAAEAAAKVSKAERQEKMAAMNLDSGWFRGGPKPNEAGNRTGPWYTRDAEEAKRYAARFGENLVVRQCVFSDVRIFRADRAYPSRLAHDVASIVEGEYYGRQGKQFADLIRKSYGADDLVPGVELWQGLKSRFGNDGAAEVIGKLQGGAAFNGITGITAGPEMMVLKNAPVRDANLAAFDPAMREKDDIFGAATIPGLLAASALSGLGGLVALHMKEREKKDKTQSLLESP